MHIYIYIYIYTSIRDILQIPRYRSQSGIWPQTSVSLEQSKPAVELLGRDIQQNSKHIYVIWPQTPHYSAPAKRVLSPTGT